MSQLFRVLNVPDGHAMNRLAEPLKHRVVDAQGNTLEAEFSNGYQLCERAFADLKLAINPPEETKGVKAEHIGDRPTKELTAFYTGILAEVGIPEQATPLHAANLVHRTQLLRAYKNPDAVIAKTCEKVVEIIGSFPKTAADIRCGRNPGDVLDPYILDDN